MLNPWSEWGIIDCVMDEDEFSVRDRIGDIIGGVDGEGEGEGEQDYASPLQSQESGTRDPQCDAAQPMTTSMGLIGGFIVAAMFDSSIRGKSSITQNK